MSTPEGHQPVSTTSSRAVPRLPSIEDDRNHRLRCKILEFLPADSWDYTTESRGRVLALRLLVLQSYKETPEGTFALLQRVAEYLGISSPTGTTAGEAP